MASGRAVRCTCCTKECHLRAAAAYTDACSSVQSLSGTQQSSLQPLPQPPCSAPLIPHETMGQRGGRGEVATTRRRWEAHCCSCSPCPASRQRLRAAGMPAPAANPAPVHAPLPPPLQRSRRTLSVTWIDLGRDLPAPRRRGCHSPRGNRGVLPAFRPLLHHWCQRLLGGACAALSARALCSLSRDLPCTLHALTPEPSPGTACL